MWALIRSSVFFSIVCRSGRPGAETVFVLCHSKADTKVRCGHNSPHRYIIKRGDPNQQTPKRRCGSVYQPVSIKHQGELIDMASERSKKGRVGCCAGRKERFFCSAFGKFSVSYIKPSVSALTNSVKYCTENLPKAIQKRNNHADDTLSFVCKTTSSCLGRKRITHH